MSEQPAKSSDLTFITNEMGRTFRDRFQTLLKEDTRFFDCLVGYFYIGGLYKLYPVLENVEKIRVLVGLQTDHVTYKMLEDNARLVDTIQSEMKSDESLLICCTSFSKAADKYPNISIKKIPKMLLGRCEFGKEDSSLNIVNMPREDDEPDFVPTGPVATNPSKTKKHADEKQEKLY